MNEIVMPKLSDTMTEGRLVSWKKRVGEAIQRGDVLAEVETDKANMELEAFVSGELLEIRVQAGEMAPVGTVIAVIGKTEEKGAHDAGEPAAAKPTVEVPATERTPQSEEPAAAAPEEAAAGVPEPGEKPPSGAAQEGSQAEQSASVTDKAAPDETQAPVAPVAPGTEAAQAPTKPVPARPVEAEAPAAPPVDGRAEAEGAEGHGPAENRERAAPMVRRRARELGVDLGTVKGSGPDGRILLQDLESQETAPVESGKPAVPQAKPAATVTKTDAEEAAKPLSRLRAAIAKTVSESWRSIPHFDVTMDLLMDEVEVLRRQLKQGGTAVTLTDVVVKGVSLALQKFPLLHASFAPEGIQMHSETNIGIAVAMQDGVLIPVINSCQRLSLLEISKASDGLAERARSGSLNEQEISGGNFAVSNLGMYGVSQFSAIIYPSHAAVLAVGAVLDAAVVRAGVPVCAKVMKVTLSADHRLVDGAYAAQFLVELKGILENPLRLLI